MTDRELKRLSREDLLEMLVTQSREVERLRREKNILIMQLKCLKSDFEMTDSLRFDLVRRGIMTPGADIRETQSELDDLIRRCESGEFTEWVISQAELERAKARAEAEDDEEYEDDEEAEEGAENDAGFDIRIFFRLRKRADEWRKHAADTLAAGSEGTADDNSEVYEDHFSEEDGYADQNADTADSGTGSHSVMNSINDVAEKDVTEKGVTEDTDKTTEVETASQGGEENKPNKDTAEMNRVQEALAWAKYRFGRKK